MSENNMRDVLQEFLFELEIKNYSKRTIKSYKNNNSLFINYLEREFNVYNLEDVKTIHIKKYIKYKQSNNLTSTYINNILKTMRSFFRYALDEGYIKENICEKIKLQKEPKTVIKTFKNEEVVAMINAFKFTTYQSARNKLIICMLVDLGVRNTELCNIKISDVRERVVLVHGKGNKERYVALSPVLKKYMLRYERIRENYLKDKNQKYDNYLLSVNCKPLTVEAIERIVRIGGEIAHVRKEIRCSPHTLRHWYSQQQLRNGLDVYSLSRLLGHETIVITKRYLQSIQDEDIIDLSIRTSPLSGLRR